MNNEEETCRMTLLGKERDSMLKLACTPLTQIGDGAIDFVAEALDELDARKVFLVVDREAYACSGAAQAVESALAHRGVTRFDRFHSNPLLSDVEEGLKHCRADRFDTILAIGGGSAVDMGKMLSIFARQEDTPRTILRDGGCMEHPALPMVAVPTTAGTGSEATHFAAVWNNHAKFSVAHASMLPDYAAVDPRLTYSLPPEITASTGLDALCQAVESLWSVGATQQSCDFALRAVELIMAHLQDAVHRPTPAARRAMSEAAHLSGRAINISKTTASHAISYTLTAHFGVPHGMAAAMTLAPMLAYNAEVSDRDCLDPRGPAQCCERIHHLITLLGCADVEEAQARLVDLLEEVGCPRRLSEIGIRDRQQRRFVAERVNQERLANNPRALDIDAVLELLEQIR